MKNPQTFGPITIADDGWIINGTRLPHDDALVLDAVCLWPCWESLAVRYLSEALSRWANTDAAPAGRLYFLAASGDVLDVVSYGDMVDVVRYVRETYRWVS